MLEARLSEAEALRAARVLAAYLNGALLAETAWRLASPESLAARPPGTPVASRASAAAVAEDLQAGLDTLLGALEARVARRAP